MDQGVELLASTAWWRPRDRKPIDVETWRGRGKHGEGKEEEEVPRRPLHLEDPAPVALNASDGLLELVDASWVLGVDRGVEASRLPAPRRRRPP